MRYIKLLLAFSLICELTIGSNCGTAQDLPKNLSKVVGERAVALAMATWPSESTLGKHLVRDNPPLEILQLKIQGKDWLHKVLTKEWWPPEETPVFYFPEDRSAVLRMAWRSHGHLVRASQNWGTLIIGIHKPEQTSFGSTKTERLDVARGLSLKVLNDTAKFLRLDSAARAFRGEEPYIIIDGIRQKVALYSFAPERTLRLSDGIVFGRSITPREAGVLRGVANLDLAPENTIQAWEHWFRRIAWWNDGDQVTFVVLKKEGAGMATTFIPE